jgi:virginiamycin B lyase
MPLCNIVLSILFLACLYGAAPAQAGVTMQIYTVPHSSGPHDVAPGEAGIVWYTAQAQGALGRLDPITGAVRQIPLGAGSAPHGLVIGPDRAVWITDGGLNAIVRYEPVQGAIKRYPLPSKYANANLNTPVFDHAGLLWFTGQNGIYGRLDPQTGAMQVYDAPAGAGPYGIAVASDGTIYYASLAGNHIARINGADGSATVIAPPTPGQGARRIWGDSSGHLWVSEWNAGQVSRYDPATRAWKSWHLPGKEAQAYAVYVDAEDMVWLTDFTANAVLRFDPKTETFTAFPEPDKDGRIRQLAGREGEVWGAESSRDRLLVLRIH